MCWSNTEISSIELLVTIMKKNKKKRWTCLKCNILLSKFNSKINCIKKWKLRLRKRKKNKKKERKKLQKKGEDYRSWKQNEKPESHLFLRNLLKDIWSDLASGALMEAQLCAISMQTKDWTYFSSGSNSMIPYNSRTPNGLSKSCTTTLLSLCHSAETVWFLRFLTHLRRNWLSGSYDVVSMSIMKIIIKLWLLVKVRSAFSQQILYSFVFSPQIFSKLVTALNCKVQFLS